MTKISEEYWKSPECLNCNTRMVMHIKAFPAGSIHYECPNCHKFYRWADRDDGTTYGDYDNWHIEEEIRGDIQKEFDEFSRKNIRYMQRQGYDISGDAAIEPTLQCNSYKTEYGGGFNPCDQLKLLLMKKYAKYEIAPCISRPIVKFSRGLTHKVIEMKLKYCPFCGFFFNSKVAY